MARPTLLLVPPAAALLLAPAAPCPAQIPEYGPLEVRARATPFANHGLPDGLSIRTDEPPLLNDRGDLLFVCEPLWVPCLNGAALKTQYGFEATRGPSLSNDGTILWSGLGSRPFTPPVFGLFRWTSGPEQLLPIDASGNIESPVVNDHGMVAFYRSPPQSAYESILQWDPETGETTVLAAGSAAGFTFTGRWLAQNNAGQVVAHDSRLGHGLYRFEAGAAPVPLLPGWPMAHTASDLADINDAGQVALRFPDPIVQLLLRSDAQTITEIARAGLPADLDLSAFNNDVAPAINNAGLVAFRARDRQNREGVYVGDGDAIVRLAAAGDTIMTDAGPALISRFDTWGIDINAAGDVAMIASLSTTGDNSSLGTAVIVARAGATCRGDWNADGAVNSADISAFLAAWVTSLSMGTLDADFNGDGAVNSADISAFLNNWLASFGPGC